MRLNYDFDKYAPPHLNERKLKKIHQEKKELRQMLLLLISSNFLFLSIALFSLALFPYAKILSLLGIVILGIHLSGTGVIAVVFLKKFLHNKEGHRYSLLQ